MSENNYYGEIWIIAIFFIFSTIFLGLSLTMLVAFNDYGFVAVYNITEGLVAQNLAPNSTLATIETMADKSLEVIPYFDIVWLMAFIGFLVGYIINSYKTRREGFMSIFGFISFGIMAMLFLLNFLINYNDFIYDLFFNKILANLTVDLIFFDFYINNLQIINLILIVVGLVVSIVPFDINLFNRRKDDDIKTQEVL